VPGYLNIPALVLSFLLPLIGGVWIFLRAGRPISFAVGRGLLMTLYAVIPVMLVAVLAAGTRQLTNINVFPIAPVVVLIFFAWVSTFTRTSSTSQQAPISHAEAEKVVQAYGAILQHSAPAPGCVADISKLPYPKEQIKQALITALRLTKDAPVREQLKGGYVLLANWQPGVGSTDLGLDISRIDQTDDTQKQAQQVVAQSSDFGKWTPIVNAEGHALESELRRMNLW
jgi:hypothetical protein